jgi:hypothetical protein
MTIDELLAQITQAGELAVPRPYTASNWLDDDVTIGLIAGRDKVLARVHGDVSALPMVNARYLALAANHADGMAAALAIALKELRALGIPWADSVIREMCGRMGVEPNHVTSCPAGSYTSLA